MSDSQTHFRNYSTSGTSLTDAITCFESSHFFLESKWLATDCALIKTRSAVKTRFMSNHCSAILGVRAKWKKKLITFLAENEKAEMRQSEWSCLTLLLENLSLRGIPERVHVYHQANLRLYDGKCLPRSTCHINYLKMFASEYIWSQLPYMCAFVYI